MHSGWALGILVGGLSFGLGVWRSWIAIYPCRFVFCTVFVLDIQVNVRQSVLVLKRFVFCTVFMLDIQVNVRQSVLVLKRFGCLDSGNCDRCFEVTLNVAERK